MTDDTLTDEELSEGNERGIKLMHKAIAKLEEIESDNVTSAALYAMWCTLTQYLAQSGWTREELVRDVSHHIELASSEGRA